MDETPWHLLTRSFSGVASEVEEVVLREWIDADSSREPFVRALRDAWTVSGELPEQHDADAAWARIQRRGAGAPRVLRIAPAADRPAGRPWVRTALRVAAVLVAAAGLSWMAIAARGRAPVTAIAPVLRETATRAGQRATVLLSDGSRVTLAGASTLRYSLKFGVTRDLYLDGEAYFEVAHDSLHPFRVHAGGAQTRVLGTKFVVRSLARDSAVVVAVAEGKVALSPERDTSLASVRAAVLTRGEVGRLAPGGEAAVLVGVDADRYLGWTDGRLVFRDTPLRDVVAELSRWYGVEARLAAASAGALADRRFTGSFKNQPIDEVLTFLALSADVRVAREGSRITVSPMIKGR